MKTELIYLSIPYSHDNKEVELERFHIANRVTANLMREGHVVFSQISHSHSIAQNNDLPTDWEYWDKSCKTFLLRCDKMIVVQIEGWDESTGVKGEMEIAKENNIPIEYYTTG